MPSKLLVHLTVAGDRGSVVWKCEVVSRLDDVSPVHEAKVGAAVKHIKVHAALVVENVLKDSGEICK